MVLTYARSHVVQQTLLAAHAAGRDFRVVVVDGRPGEEGKSLLKALVAAGLSCTYIHLSAVDYMMKVRPRALARPRGPR